MRVFQLFLLHHIFLSALPPPPHRPPPLPPPLVSVKRKLGPAECFFTQTQSLQRVGTIRGGTRLLLHRSVSCSSVSCSSVMGPSLLLLLLLLLLGLLSSAGSLPPPRTSFLLGSYRRLSVFVSGAFWEDEGSSPALFLLQNTG
ncbi:hypothetical protein EYF80_065691 [Liparis tanakae]|uniref:Uncharacterized protein n=1 Tax=Liparis tanakae TaxID=230148 RepID=A0A4Z2E5I9_9TELE|nr:hypothetical protein EYF80_065691 [Liparis tanakae]